VAPLIRFEGVGFAHRGHAPVLAGLDLEIRPGEVIGLVGVNGAGKTTLLTLLAGLRRPTAGRITADGEDIALLDPRSWRERIGVVFQDFARLPLTVAENVSLARPDLAQAALAAAGATLGHTPDTPLLAGRANLSGGQWQQLALARAIAAARGGCDLIALDEPTAHLDVRAEAAFFDRVVTALPGTTLLLVSHRIATLRRADRIVVLDGGRVAESGPHRTLLAAGGLYAELFRTQAARFAGEAA
jgi:ATP-binding cassette subfamily B protein